MKAYICVSTGFSVEVDVENHPNYVNEIIVGGQRLTLYGIKRTDIDIIRIFPGVKSFAQVQTSYHITCLGTIEKTIQGIVLTIE